MRVVMLASEAHPLAKTGGLGDVLAALPPALAAAGVDVTVCLPAYRGILRRLAAAPVVLVPPERALLARLEGLHPERA